MVSESYRKEIKRYVQIIASRDMYWEALLSVVTENSVKIE